MGNYFGALCMKYGTGVYYDLLRGTASFQPINTGLFTIR